ncbi:unnamed protein product [Linum tenue]|uniref:Ribosomal protein L36 n=1 Tax=Linum tenue TaxID=586396 RepID=A0AAV0LE54_9ROSI|nr:unnamed protein product [Linum tenue]
MCYSRIVGRKKLCLKKACKAPLFSKR